MRTIVRFLIACAISLTAFAIADIGFDVNPTLAETVLSSFVGALIYSVISGDWG